MGWRRRLDVPQRTLGLTSSQIKLRKRGDAAATLRQTMQAYGKPSQYMPAILGVARGLAGMTWPYHWYVHAGGRQIGNMQALLAVRRRTIEEAFAMVDWLESVDMVEAAWFMAAMALAQAQAMLDEMTAFAASRMPAHRPDDGA